MRSMNKIIEEYWNNKTLEEKKEWNRRVYGHEVPAVGSAYNKALDAKREMDKYFRLMMNPIYGQEFVYQYNMWKERYEDNMAYYEEMKDCKLIC